MSREEKDILKEIEQKLEEENSRRNEAIVDQEIARNMKNEAEKKEKNARAVIREFDIAKNHIEKAQMLKEEKVENEEKTEFAETPAENETVVVKENKNKAGSFVTGLVVGAAALAILAGSVKLYKESKTGDVKLAPSSIGMSDTVKDEPEDSKESNEEEQVPNTNYSYNYDNNATVVQDTEYVPLTTEAFEALTTETINTLRNYGLTASDEDIIKYVMIRNIDKLRQDNNELISNIIGEQDPIEVFADADTVIDAIMTYNLLHFAAYQNTDGFISSSVGVFDETQKARALEIERRVFEIGANYKNEEKYNELTYALLRDMIDPSKEISELEDGVSYGVEWINMYMVRSTFGTDRYIKLNDTNAEMIKYYVSFAGDGEEYEMNALVNGNVRNINALLNECTNGKTRTR